jgi:hypothetical protein
VRVWSLPDGRLLRILRLPVDFGDIGKAQAVAISPDGSTVAVGGYISVPSHGFNIFLFDRASIPTFLYRRADTQGASAMLGDQRSFRLPKQSLKSGA